MPAFSVRPPVRQFIPSSFARRLRPPACRAVKQKFGSFDELIAGSDTPVLVDFYATWCGPCVMMADALNEIAPSFKGRLKIVKIDTDKYSNLASRFNIAGLPTLILFKDGKPVDRMDGFVPAADLAARLNQSLA